MSDEQRVPILRPVMVLRDVIDEITIADLRAVLAPLLDAPFLDLWSYSDPDETCIFCKYAGSPFDRQSHQPDCPVLRKDELLGRA